MRCLEGFVGATSALVLLGRGSLLGWAILGINTGERDIMLKSVIYHFRGNGEFPRLRIGIGRPPGQMDPKAFMLQKFNVTARERIDAALLEGAHALEQVLSKGFSESSNCFNTTQKYKHIRLQTLPT
ncbi:hypothetical protein H5410_009108 [Solanum commersonii]|uniref:Peptidyl-tRNA hydrolase n=1 Tax=Solanum commersonii TaxID=4109 RepID=A0A9J6AIK0_SOLCO|nr:hypothetical protein H5410_009108 [Solanum commersonii]